MQRLWNIPINKLFNHSFFHILSGDITASEGLLFIGYNNSLNVDVIPRPHGVISVFVFASHCTWLPTVLT